MRTFPITRWVGIDEAGYGPNMGPLVMSAVTAQGPSGAPDPDLWQDLVLCVDRAGGARDRLWIDDSKRVTQGKDGIQRLVAVTLALAKTLHPELAGQQKLSRDELLAALGAGSTADGEWDLWQIQPEDTTLANWDVVPILKPSTAFWELIATHVQVVGPRAFNAGLIQHQNKATVHFEAFGKLLKGVWESAAGCTVRVNSDKHGGRHFYHAALMDLFPGLWIERGEEGPEMSRYAIHAEDRNLILQLAPRSDASDGLVALASIVSKCLREIWMKDFNRFWINQFPKLKPTAGYPVDARRFRQSIEGECNALRLPREFWWRSK